MLGIVLQELLCWVWGMSGSRHLKALIVFDEVYGFLPPHPANPPTKRPLAARMKQARGFGVGVVVATQNPMDLDYRALSNAGLWFIGRLQTDADRERVLDGVGEVASGDGCFPVTDFLRGGREKSRLECFLTDHGRLTVEPDGLVFCERESRVVDGKGAVIKAF